MSEPMALIKRLADQYVEEARGLVAALRQNYPHRNLLQGRAAGYIPRQGELPGAIHFEFHGVGCLFQAPLKKLDLDFGPDGKCDGFDAWRLHLFANENELALGKPSLAEIEEGLLQLEHLGQIVRPKTEPSPHLFYFQQEGGGT